MVVPFEVTVALPWRDYFVIVYSADERLDLACDSLWFYRTAINKPGKHTSLAIPLMTSSELVCAQETTKLTLVPTAGGSPFRGCHHDLASSARHDYDQ